MNTEGQLKMEALDQVSSGCGHSHAHRVHQAGSSERSQQTVQQPQPIADLAVIMAGARIKF